MITEDSSEFLSIASKWKEKLTPYDGISLYKSKEDARIEYQIVDFEQTEAYQRHIEIFGK